MIKKLATIGAAAALLAASAIPVFAVPPGPPALAVTGCPGRSIVDPGVGAQAVSPNLALMADGGCVTPNNQL